jgi:hypothetical protein
VISSVGNHVGKLEPSYYAGEHTNETVLENNFINWISINRKVKLDLTSMYKIQFKVDQRL